MILWITAAVCWFKILPLTISDLLQVEHALREWVGGEKPSGKIHFSEEFSHQGYVYFSLYSWTYCSLLFHNLALSVHNPTGKLLLCILKSGKTIAAKQFTSVCCMCFLCLRFNLYLTFLLQQQSNIWRNSKWYQWYEFCWIRSYGQGGYGCWPSCMNLKGFVGFWVFCPMSPVGVLCLDFFMFPIVPSF